MVNAIDCSSLEKATLHIMIINDAMTHLESTLSYELFNNDQYKAVVCIS